MAGIESSSDAYQMDREYCTLNSNSRDCSTVFSVVCQQIRNCNFYLLFCSYALHKTSQDQNEWIKKYSGKFGAIHNS